jgi:hypothetical protein
LQPPLFDSLNPSDQYIALVRPGSFFAEYRRQLTPSSDYDIICGIEGLHMDFRAELGRYLVCECKDWADRAVDFTAIAKFCRVLDSAKCKSAKIIRVSFSVIRHDFYPNDRFRFCSGGCLQARRMKSSENFSRLWSRSAHEPAAIRLVVTFPGLAIMIIIPGR